MTQCRAHSFPTNHGVRQTCIQILTPSLMNSAKLAMWLNLSTLGFPDACPEDNDRAYLGQLSCGLNDTVPITHQCLSIIITDAKISFSPCQSPMSSAFITLTERSTQYLLVVLAFFSIDRPHLFKSSVVFEGWRSIFLGLSRVLSMAMCIVGVVEDLD